MDLGGSKLFSCSDCISFSYGISLTGYSWISPVYRSLACEFVFYLIVGLTFFSLIHREIEFTVLAIAFVTAVCFYLQSKFDVRILKFAMGILLMRLVVDKAHKVRICYGF
jgi:hypothetical protein